MKNLTDKQKAIRTCNMGTMTPSMKNTMIKSALRRKSMHWKPINEAKKTAKIDRREIAVDVEYHNPTKTMPDRISSTVMINYYMCSGCKKGVPEKVPLFKEKTHKTADNQIINTFSMKLKNNVDIDHINPVVSIGKSINWHDVVDRMFDENINNYRLLCKSCHKSVTNQENEKRRRFKSI